jgi:hypothetical protein
VRVWVPDGPRLHRVRRPERVRHASLPLAAQEKVRDAGTPKLVPHKPTDHLGPVDILKVAQPMRRCRPAFEHLQIASINPLERLNREIKRRDQAATADNLRTGSSLKVASDSRLI